MDYKMRVTGNYKKTTKRFENGKPIEDEAIYSVQIVHFNPDGQTVWAIMPGGKLEKINADQIYQCRTEKE